MVDGASELGAVLGGLTHIVVPADAGRDELPAAAAHHGVSAAS